MPVHEDTVFCVWFGGWALEGMSQNFTQMEKS